MFPVSKRYHRSVFLLYQNNALPAKHAAKLVQIRFGANPLWCKFAESNLPTAALCGRQNRSLALLGTPLLPSHQHRCGYGDRGVRADKNAHHQRE
jgi:hypothetical protein